MKTKEQEKLAQGEAKLNKKHSLKSSVCIGVACGLFIFVVGAALLYLTNPATFVKPLGNRSSTQPAGKTTTAANKPAENVPVAYIPTANQQIAGWDHYLEGDKLRGTIMAIDGSSVTLKLLNEVRVDKNGNKINAKRDSLKFLDGSDTVYINVTPEDQGRILLGIEGSSYSISNAKPIYGTMADLVPGTWACFIWAKEIGSSDPLKIYWISLMKDGIAAN